MSEAVAAVNATSTNTVPNPSIEQPKIAPIKQESVGQREIPQRKASDRKFTDKVEETLWRVNEPTEDETSDEKSMSEIIDKATKDAATPTKDTGVQSKAQEPAPEPVTTGKQKVEYNGKEYELDADQQKRFMQKGIMHDLKHRDFAAKTKEVEAREQAAIQREKSAQAIFERGLDAIAEVKGEEEARKMAEAFLRPRIEREMLPEQERQLLDIQTRAERAEKALADRDQRDQQRDIDSKVDGHLQHFQKIIVEALDKTGVPKDTRSAREMAEWIERGIEKGIDYSPDQLAEFVREDNVVRVQALTQHYVSQIEAAKKAGDSEAIVKAGESLVGILGEPVMHAIGKYHLAKIQKGQPKTAPQILDTPKVKPPEQKKRGGYMTEDEFAAKRKQRVALMEQGIDPGEWD